MSFKCLQTEARLTAALAGRATEAERLLLEEHLETCAACREKRAAFESLRRARRWEPELSEAGRGRVLRALQVAAATPAGRSTVPPRWAGWSTVAVAAAFGVAMVGLVVPAWRQAVAPRDRVRDVVAAANARDRLRPGPDGKVTLEGAVVELAPGTEALWRAASRTLELRRGFVVVETTAAAGGAVRVATPSFTATAVGTRFSVDLGGVATARGLVRVFAGADLLLAEVGPGQRWSEAGSTLQPTAAAPAPRVDERPGAPGPTPRGRPAAPTGRGRSRG